MFAFPLVDGNDQSFFEGCRNDFKVNDGVENVANPLLDEWAREEQVVRRKRVKNPQTIPP